MRLPVGASRWATEAAARAAADDDHVVVASGMLALQPPVAKPGYSVMPPSTNSVVPTT